jgi:hypothetical protein
MALDIVRREVGGLTREERRAAVAIRQAQLPGQIAAAKIEAASFAAHVALHHAGMLSATEARLLQFAPLGEQRYKAIADAFAGYACHEIALLAHK